MAYSAGTGNDIRTNSEAIEQSDLKRCTLGACHCSCWPIGLSGFGGHVASISRFPFASAYILISQIKTRVKHPEVGLKVAVSKGEDGL
jgi:hypothetical protein